ncbi:PLP-dependent cysteine synthase family protein [Chitinibacter bivalviorum]|uniref:L-cysteine desulfhydrase Cds1 n=1 Tax=Chitinibacter bivalviorum TaxID=2739434 RepID=A0A7H9BE73_9NEIS|nr:PLP-dependent cysteine synthase family protein [Chitinibacter bivalviorum]QLG86885.1 PLP-dependent cysteine synthase family protein [Chitinibacter bivalviorum]
MPQQRHWLNQAIQTIEADYNRSADTHLIPVRLDAYPDIDFYLKDESSHPTGSLKHRLARSLFLYALSNGWLKEGSTVIEASSGSTAVSEAYFARLLNLPFIAVMPASTSQEKIAAIEFYGGRCHLVANAGEISIESQRLARETGGHFMDQFTYAERATDWRANNNIAESIFNQMALERFPIPKWIVASCGTGGTSATLGRYVRYRKLASGIACVDPENSVFFSAYQSGQRDLTLTKGSRIEGIGRPKVEPSFIPSVIDTMLQIPDTLSLAAMNWLSQKIGKKVGGSTGCNWIGALQLAQDMQAKGQAGSIVTLLCDSGERYAQTYYSAEWLTQNGFDLSAALAQISSSCEHGSPLPSLSRIP